MPRFFLDLPPSSLENPKPACVVTLSPADSHHAARVLRLTAGDQVTVCDGRGHDFQGQIKQIRDKAVEVELLTWSENKAESGPRIHLLQGLPKGQKMDAIVQDAVELGAWSIQPILFERSVSRPKDKQLQGKQTRWQEIAKAAAEQSQRGLVPTVHPLLSWPQYLQQLGPVKPREQRLIAWEGEKSCSLASLLASLPAEAWTGDSDFYLLVGPEGGLSPNEVEEGEAAAFRAFTLGERILRTETAGPACLAMLDFAYQNRRMEVTACHGSEV